MKKLFYASIFGLIAFELLNVYFIMPMPGSQETNTIDLAYFFYKFRWLFRVSIGALALFAFFRHSWSSKILPIIAVAVWGLVLYTVHFMMAADTMFYQPNKVFMLTATQNKVDTNRLILGIERAGAAKAYPIQYLGYHHQVLDTLAGERIMVTYCTVCRSGRIFEPMVAGKPAQFRLVGMDHFNAMFEDQATGSWWRQATGEAVAGKLKGSQLRELAFFQMPLSQWIRLHPNTLVMQPDPAYQAEYDSMSRYETGRGKSALTRSDSLSWQKKSWVIGIKTKDSSKAFDWNLLKKQGIVNDFVGKMPVVLVLGKDKQSFFAFERKAANQLFTLKNDTIYNGLYAYSLDGKPAMQLNNSAIESLKPMQAVQEFWHSWRTFHPETERSK